MCVTQPALNSCLMGNVFKSFPIRRAGGMWCIRNLGKGQSTNVRTSKIEHGCQTCLCMSHASQFFILVLNRVWVSYLLTPRRPWAVCILSTKAIPKIGMKPTEWRKCLWISSLALSKCCSETRDRLREQIAECHSVWLSLLSCDSKAEIKVLFPQRSGVFDSPTSKPEAAQFCLATLTKGVRGLTRNRLQRTKYFLRLGERT